MYLYGKLDEEIYMEQPKGFKVPGKEFKVIQLLRTLYSLKQARLAWWNALNESMSELGFERLKSEPGIFLYKKRGTTMVVTIIYVDDTLFCGPNKVLVDEVKTLFMCKWECRDLDPATEFLHMRIRRLGSKILIDQCAYLDKLLDQFGLLIARTAPTPLLEGYYPPINNEAADPETQSLFQTLIGSLLYIALMTCPNINYAVASLFQHSANPNRKHIRMATRVFQYLLDTHHYSLVFDGKPNDGLIAFVDSDWASDPDSHRSHTGWITKLAGGVFSWASRQQKNITYSSTEAKYVAANDCARQAVWIRNIFGEMGYNIKPFPICVNNQGAIFMASNPMTEHCNKHIDI